MSLLIAMTLLAVEAFLLPQFKHVSTAIHPPGEQVSTDPVMASCVEKRIHSHPLLPAETTDVNDGILHIIPNSDYATMTINA